MRISTTMEIKQAGKGWDLTCYPANRDFHVRKEDGFWLLIEFDSRIEDDNEAHLKTTEHESMNEAFIESFRLCEAIINKEIKKRRQHVKK